MGKTNYLIGKAEVLAKKVDPPKMNPPGAELYSVDEAMDRLLPQLQTMNNDLNRLPAEVCPGDFTVSHMTLHPSYIAKGHFPSRLLREMNVMPVGSKTAVVTPDRWTRRGTPEPTPSTTLFVAGKRQSLKKFQEELASGELHLVPGTPFAKDFVKIWSFEAPEPKSKIRHNKGAFDDHYEVGLQLLEERSEFIVNSFVAWAQRLGFDVKQDLAIEVSNLWFAPLVGDSRKILELASHSFVRVIRPLPMLRSWRPLARAGEATSPAKLPTTLPLAADVKAAILDGGLGRSRHLNPWVNYHGLSDPTAADHVDGPDHGVAVTSAFLFGPILPGTVCARPYCPVDHYRILDHATASESPLELYRTLGHIESVLISRQYEFINLSLGPDLPLDDDEIHPWTSLIDSYLADGSTFLTIAAGNNGENDSLLGLHRVQVPSDCVNAVAVGSADRAGESWARASYSACGPGRSPGRVKPDILAFGGSPRQYFHIVNGDIYPRLVPTQGTSFAAPYLLRKAAGIRALFGNGISPLAIKALLINTADRNEARQSEVGWGRAAENVEDLIQSPDGVAKILYQGELEPGKYLRVPLPLPSGGVKGKVHIKATCCFTTPVDPQDTSMYTRAGVEIAWSPRPGKKEGFFQQVKQATEAELRRDAAKWETVLHAEKGKFGSAMDNPAFEIHYMAREGGAAVNGADKIRYAFVVTLTAPKHASIFSDILNAYSQVLAEIEPRVSVDINEFVNVFEGE